MSENQLYNLIISNPTTHELMRLYNKMKQEYPKIDLFYKSDQDKFDQWFKKYFGAMVE